MVGIGTKKRGVPLYRISTTCFTMYLAQKTNQNTLVMHCSFVRHCEHPNSVISKESIGLFTVR